MKYFGSKEKYVDKYMLLTPNDGYGSSLELCAGTATFSRKVAVSDKKIAVEKDPGQAALLRVIRDNPADLISAVNKLPYSPEVFDDASIIRSQAYVGYSDLEKAVAKKVLIDYSFNSMGITYRNVDKGCETLEDILYSQKFKYSLRSKNLISIMSDSSTLQGVDIIEDDMFNHLHRLNDPSLWTFIDSPYRWKLRGAKKGYDLEWDDNMHRKLLSSLTDMYMNHTLKSKLIICCYVDMNDLRNDMYCQALMPLGFKLVVIAKAYRPRIIKANTKEKIKPVVMECVFINYDPIVEDDMKTFTFREIFGGDDIEKDSSHQR